MNRLHGLLRSILVFALSYVLMTAFSHAINTNTPTLVNGSSLPADIARRQYVLDGLTHDPHTGDIVLTLFPGEANVPVCLILSDASNCVVYQGEEIVFSYLPSDSYQRVAMIPLKWDVSGDPLTLRIASANLPGNFSADLTGGILPRFKLAIASIDAAEKSVQAATAINAACCGMYLLIIAVTLALYAHTRTEKYLIMLALASIAAFIATLLTSGFPGITIRQSLYLRVRAMVVSLPLVSNASFALYLVREQLGCWGQRIVRFRNVLLLTALTMFLQLVLPVNLYHIYRWLFFIPTIFCLLEAGVQDSSDAVLLIIGASICQELHDYVYVVNSLRLIPAGVPILYLRYSQPGYLLNHLIGLFVVCRLYSCKFSEAKQLSEALTQINRNLDRIVEERTQELRYEQEQRRGFMLNAFHDLRSPIFVMRGCLTALPKGARPAADTQKLLLDRLSCMERLVEDLFLAAKFETDELPFDFSALDLSALAQCVVTGYQCLAEDRQIELTTDIAPKLTIWGDRIRIEQAIQNLINNAMHHTPAGGRITLLLTSSDADVCLSVEDNGSGIDERDLPHIFEKYYRAPGNGADDRSFGLGLSIVREIVSAHRGNIQVDSSLGKGTRFSVRFPAFADVEMHKGEAQ